jgi:hypothetical protein
MKLIEMLSGDSSWTITSGGEDSSVIVQIDRKYADDLATRAACPLRVKVVLPFNKKFNLDKSDVEKCDDEVLAGVHGWGVLTIIATTDAFREYVLYTQVVPVENMNSFHQFLAKQLSKCEVQLYPEMDVEWQFYRSALPKDDK